MHFLCLIEPKDHINAIMAFHYVGVVFQYLKIFPYPTLCRITLFIVVDHKLVGSSDALRCSCSESLCYIACHFDWLVLYLSSH